MSREIPLPGGVVALVDDADYIDISAHSWHLKRANNRPGYRYAQRTIRLGSGRKAGKKTVTLHRELMGAQPGDIVDHINGNPLDNRRSNLRLVTFRENAMNVVSSKNRKRGGYKGVNWHKKAGKWQASIAAGDIRLENGKRKLVYLGLFVDPIEAAKAYDRKAREVFGEFAACNFEADE